MSRVLNKTPKIDKAALTQHLQKYSVENMIAGYLAAGV